MKIAIIGTGSMGGLFGWKLAQAGAEVWGYDVSQPHVDQINAVGLTLDFTDHSEVARIHATTDPARIGEADAVLVFVKGGATEAAMTAARGVVGPKTLIVTMQNGIGNAERIAALFPGHVIAHGMTTLAAQIEGPGRVRATSDGKGEISFWPLTGDPDATARELCRLLDGGGMQATLDPQIDLRIWRKLVVNCCCNSVCGLLDCRIAQAMAQPGIQTLFETLTAEIVAVAGAKGIALGLDEALAYLRGVGAAAGGHFPSMVADLRAHRRTEIDALNGAILREAAAHGLTAPANAAITALIRAKQEIGRG
ncbi:ketopantoate reductase family protein [Paenirhodobacter sp.]|uniref:ketopantoate reductase family protein n=1 Tax=Paenirhodobacter sp. TaxID=1965326 RepID=UPI003B3DA6C9